VSRARTKPRFAFEVRFLSADADRRWLRTGRVARVWLARGAVGVWGSRRSTTGKADRRETKGGGSPLCVFYEVDDCSYSQLRASLKKQSAALCDW